MTSTVPPWLRPTFQPTGRRASVLLIAFADRDILGGSGASFDVAAPATAPLGSLDVQGHDNPDWVNGWRTGALRNIAATRLTHPDQLETATHCYSVRLDLDDPADLTHLQLAWAAASVLAHRGCFAVLDAYAAHWLDGAEVAALPADRPFTIQSQISVVAEDPATPGFGYVVHTRGMAKFARPDLIAGVPADQIEYTGKILNHLARLQADGALLTVGQVLRFDSSHTMTLAAYEPDHNAPEVHLNNDGLLLLSD